ncbi:DUF2637 domain-containing protein [Streptomyces sp. SDT5-1]|uniref:DUF2637 domain-containing protein n=1 Tax=Streptomyces sp. SDT5-1 TaxID=3406418 RepID=UPI003FD15593
MNASHGTPPRGHEPNRTSGHRLLSPDACLRGGCTLTVAGVAAYASYVHQRAFALQGGADPVSASLWPLSVDGLLLLATTALLKQTSSRPHSDHPLVWLSFVLAIAVSLAANIAAAPALAWKPVLVAGWPPIALLLAVELLTHPASPHDGNRSRRPRPKRPDGREEPLLEAARRIDLRHREAHHRPVSAETLRKQLRVGASRARQLHSQLSEGKKT